MPWNNDNGGQGPWGQGPWGQGPKDQKPSGGGGNRGSGGNLPPDLDEFLRKGRDSLKNALPGGAGAGGRVSWLLPVVAVLGFVAFQSVYQIPPDSRGLVLRFGAYSRTVQPGLNFALWPVEKMVVLPVAAENQISIGEAGDEGLVLTGDENMVDIRFKVLWKIAEPENFLFNIADAKAIIRAVAESAMREIVGRTPADQVLTTGRLAIQDQVREIVQHTLDTYTAGVQITGITLENVDPPPPVLDAFEEVQRAKQNQVNMINQAEQYTNQTLRNAEGTAAKAVEDAKGYKARVTAEAKGAAQRFEQVFNEYAKAKDVTRERLFLETMEKVFGTANKVVLDPGKGGTGVVPYLPLPPVVRPQTTGEGN